MSAQVWSFMLQWSRVGINAALFLTATHFLTLSEIGLFATLFAPIRLSQGLHRAGIAECVIILGKSPRRLDGLFLLSVASGLCLSVIFASVGILTAQPAMCTLAIIPLLNGLAAVPEGLLRKSLRLKALALRTSVVQTSAAALALTLLIDGAGVWALVAFALANATGTCLLTICLARWHPSRLPSAHCAVRLLPKVAQISGRDLAGAAQFPLAQLAIGLTLGLSAAGAFQIATRIYTLIDALAVSPLRFIALPQLARETSQKHLDISMHLSRVAWLSAWIWAGVLLFAPDLMRLMLSVDYTEAAAPILRAFAGLGLCSALIMPINQALTARSHTGLVLHRAIAMLCVGTALLLPALFHTPITCALALSCAALLVNTWYINLALPRLGLSMSDLSAAAPPLIAAVIVVLTVLLTPSLPLLAQMICGTFLYFGIATLLRDPQMRPA